MLELQRETDASVASQKETVTTRIYDVKYLTFFYVYNIYIYIYIYIGSSKERGKEKMMRQKSQNSNCSVARQRH